MKMSDVSILVIDDQRSARHILRELLERFASAKVDEAASEKEARGKMSTGRYDLALIDIRLGPEPGNVDGLSLVPLVKQAGTIPIIVSSSSEMREIRAAMRLGAHDYVLKDDLCEELVLPIVEEACGRRRLENEIIAFRARGAEDAFRGMIGTSPAMSTLRLCISRVAVSDRPVLVRGPTGSGKELVVRALHVLGAHPDAPIIDVNCGAIPEALMESQLFGHERGAFTGADRRHEGYLSMVGHGTLFFDEVGELPTSLQAKLLRVLETGTFRLVGGTESCRFKGRVVAATHANLEEMVRLKTFREDLFYRLNVLEIRVPGLDERIEDIPLLVAHFARQQRRQLTFAPAAMEWLKLSAWPGNIRQLRNLIDRVTVFADGDAVDASVLATHARAQTDAAAGEESLALLARTALRLPVRQKLLAMERALIGEALNACGGNKSAAARLLGIHRKAIERRLDNDESDDAELDGGEDG